jgi:hypothetical protein
MNKRNITLIIAGVVIIAAGCAIKKEARVNPPTGYVVTFGSSSAPVMVKEGFKAKLPKAEWRRDIVFKPKGGNDPTPNAGSGVSVPTDVLLSIPQRPGSNGLNVTQRVRFNGANYIDLINLLNEIN